MCENIEEICAKLSLALETSMNQSSDRQERMKAYQLCEDFKEKSPDCVLCGFHLASTSASTTVKCFGLHLIEHCIKDRWNSLTVDEKVFIKESSLKLITTGTNYVLNDKTAYQNALSKIIVEMIKREWPQQWPKLIDEFTELCQIGDSQTEIVLLTLLRLIEDTIIFQNIPAQRRREIHQALTSNMHNIFGFIGGLLYYHLDKCKQLEFALREDPQQVLSHYRVAEAVLETLTAFVEWVPVNLIMTSDGLLLKKLCITLSNPYLQLKAADCLLQIVSRKGKLEDRKPLLVLFNTSHMEAIFNAANAAASLPLEEIHYFFLKRLCHVLIGIGSQLHALWGTTEEIHQPQNFRMYIEAILEFTKHPSQVLSSCTLPLWCSFFRHEQISKDPILRSFIPHIAQTAKEKLIKIGYPSRNDCLSCSYSRMDFDSDEDFNQFFPKFRADVADVLRLATVLEPMITFDYAAKWLEEQLKKHSDIGEDGDLKLCNLNSPALLEWDALSVYLESVLSRILQTSKSKPAAEDGIRLLKGVLNYNTQDPLVLSCILSCISALFVFLTMAPDTLPAVLEKIFSTLVFSLPGQTKATRSRAVKNVRRHACSSLVKICKQYPKLLLTSFEQIYMHVGKLSTDPDQLSQMEKCTLLEALILISNQFENFQKQSSFIKEILSPINSTWLTQDTRRAFLSVGNFMTYIGLDQPPVEPSNDDVVGINRSQIILCVNMILAVIKRSRWPEDLDAAQRGGFVKGIPSSSISAVLCNPATSHILPLLENLLLLLRCFNQLWTPTSVENISHEYARACDMLETDKNNVLGVNNPSSVDMSDPIVKQPLERMQHFLTTVHDNCYHILGNAGQSLGNEFYQLPGLADCIISCILQNIDSIPDYRVRPIIRVFMKPFVQCCPSEYYHSALIPVLVQLCPYMFQRLNNKWLQLTQWFEQSNLNEEENSESQEVLEDQLNRQLTREYLDLLAAVLQVKRTGNLDINNDTAMEEDDRNSSVFPDTLSDLGQIVLKHQILGPTITRCYFRALSWNDTTSCNKSLYFCGPIMKQLLNTGLIGSEDAKDLFICILMGLQQHGQHEMNQSILLNLGLQTYELLRPLNPSILDVMLEIPNCSLEDLQAFDEKLINKQWPEKKKKEMFKNIIGSIIGKNVGQLFKREVHIKNLPPLFQQSTPKIPSVLVTSDDIGLCRLFGEEIFDS